MSLETKCAWFKTILQKSPYVGTKNSCSYYRPQQQSRKGYVFTGVCLSRAGRCTPPGQTPHSQTDTPFADTPLGRYLLGRHRLGRHSLERHPPCGHCSGRYASCWNAFLLLKLICELQLGIAIFLGVHSLSIIPIWIDIWPFPLFWTMFRFSFSGLTM